MTVENLVYSLCGAGLGLTVGLAMSVWWDRGDDGHRILRVRLSNRWQQMFFGAVGVMAVFSVALTAVKTEDDQRQTQDLADITTLQAQIVARQTFCNRELIRVIGENSAVAAADRINLDQLMSAIGAQVLNPDPDPAVRANLFRAAFRRYTDNKAANEAARQPYPPPNCGE